MLDGYLPSHYLFERGPRAARRLRPKRMEAPKRFPKAPRKPRLGLDFREAQLHKRGERRIVPMIADSRLTRVSFDCVVKDYKRSVKTHPEILDVLRPCQINIL